jgi:dynactin complex subunit
LLFFLSFFLAAGDTDGLVKSKRYFTCPAKHGKIVRITNVMAVLPSKVWYTHAQYAVLA